MDDLIKDIEFAVEHNRWVLALAGALALPDMCAALQSPNGSTTGSKYKNWVSKYLAADYPLMDPDELYKLRCSLLHQGTTSTIKYHRIVFFPPNAPFVMHNTKLGNPNGQVLALHLPRFCADIISAVAAWRDEHQGTATYQRNAGALLRWRNEGLEGYAEGIPILA